MPGVAARIAEVIADVDLAQTSGLAGVLRKHGCAAPVRAVAKSGGEALGQVFQHASGDWIALVDARLRAFTAGWLERLEQGVSGRFTAGIAPDITGANGERLPGAWILGGGGWSVAGPAPAGGAEGALGALYGNPREVSCLSPHLSIWRREAVSAPGITAQMREAGRFDVAQVSLALRERGHDLVARPFVAAQFALDGPAPAPRSDAELEVPEERRLDAQSLGNAPRGRPALPSGALAHVAARRHRSPIPGRAAPGREAHLRIPVRSLGLGRGAGAPTLRRARARLSEFDAQVVMMDTHERGYAPNGLEWRRLGAGTLLAHNFFHDYQLVALHEYARDGKALLALGMDDLLTDLPPGNPYAATIYPDIAARIARAVSRCHRLVVSTQALADAYGRGIETHVVPNAIDGEAWKGLQNRPRAGERARIGWAGARQHLDDLALLEKVVAVTHREVDWVFLGMCPPALRRYAAEFHDMVPIALYPAALASLGLDAAVAPLADSAFNRAKSDLKVLEYGILSIPVIASSVGEYRHPAPP